MLPADKMSEIHRRLLQKKEAAATLGTIYKFVFDDGAGGTYVLDLKSEIGVREGDGPADCTLRFSTADGMALLEGRANGISMFITGKLKVEGDISRAVKLPTLMSILR
jgi:putative sterol carrier protein